MKTFYVYIMSNKSGTLYTGVTNDLERRVYEHKTGEAPGFTSKYHVTWLLYYEAFANVTEAIAAEKRIKGWTRAKKLALIERMNPLRADLSSDWYQQEQNAPDPSLRSG